MSLGRSSLDWEGEKKQKFKWNAENNIRMNFGHGRVIVCVLHRFAEGIWPCKLDHVNTASKETGVDGERENVDQLILYGSDF